jgi:DNA repair exonuclease SbcCD nuclease subunit
MAFRFLHLADLHLETSFGGAPATRERLRRATLEAFDRAIDYAIRERLHAVLAAGDLYDDAVLSLRAELGLVERVQRLASAGIHFLYACGNHDPGGPTFRAARLGLGEGSEGGADGGWRARVHVFRDARPRAVEVRDAAGEPVGLVVGCGHAGPNEGANLAARFERPSARHPLAVVGLLHSHVTTAWGAERHERYAPSTPDDYRRAGFSYWALGHIHLRQRAVPGLPVFYAGNLQGRNARETGEKGGLVVEAHAGADAEPEFVRFAPVRWLREKVEDLPAQPSATALVEHLARRIERLRAWPGEELVARLELAGATPLARSLRRPEELESLAQELALRAGAVEVELRPGALRLPGERPGLAGSPTVVGEALSLIERAGRDDALLAELAPEPLAGAPGAEPEARLAYLRELLAELPEELALRASSEGEA